MTKVEKRSKTIDYLWKFLVGVGVVITTTILISGGQEYGDIRRATNEYPEIKQRVKSLEYRMNAGDSIETIRYIIDTVRTGRMQQSITEMRQEVREMRQDLKLSNRIR